MVVEEFLDGEEASFFALLDGEAALPLASAQDHKAAGDGDTGPNTGGMGAYSPAPVVTREIEAQVRRPQGRGVGKCRQGASAWACVREPALLLRLRRSI